MNEHSITLGPTLRAWEMEAGETVEIRNAGSKTHRIELVSTRATVDSTSVPYPDELITAGPANRPVLPCSPQPTASVRPFSTPGVPCPGAVSE